jgi:hypothetical protein
MISIDIFTVATIRLRVLYVLVALAHDSEMGNEPLRQAWEIGQQLKTKTQHVYGVHSEPPKTQQSRYLRSNLVLTRQKCGRVLFRKE